MTKKEQAEKSKKVYATKVAGVIGYSHRIKEQRQVIKDAKRSIKMFKLLKKQVRTTYKLALLEK